MVQATSAQATDHRNLAAMALGSFAFSSTRAACLSIFSDGLGAGKFLQASTWFTALGAEVASFRIAQRILQPEINEPFWQPGAFLQTGMEFAVLKVPASLMKTRSFIARHSGSALAMMSAQYLSEAWVSESRQQEGFSPRFLHAFVSSFALEAGGSLSALATGHRLSRLQSLGENHAQICKVQNSLSLFNHPDVKLVRQHAEDHPIYQELDRRLERGSEFRDYVSRNFSADDPVLASFVETLSDITKVHRAQAEMAVLRYSHQSLSASLRRYFLDPLLRNSDPECLVRGDEWQAGKPLIHETMEWMNEIAFRHADPWTRYYAVRFAFEWSRAHPEIALPAFDHLRRGLERLALEAQQDIFQPNFMLGWQLFHGLNPGAAMSESFYSNFPFGIKDRGSCPEFGLKEYEYYTEAEKAFRRHVTTLRAPPFDATTPFGKRSLYDVRPHHSLADFSPTLHLRQPILKAKYAQLNSLCREGRLNAATLQNDYYDSKNLDATLTVRTWKGRIYWSMQGHHRSAALYLAVEKGIAPPTLVENLRVREIDWSSHYPYPVFFHFMTKGARTAFTWEDILPDRNRFEIL